MFKSELDCKIEVVHESSMDWSSLMVPKKIRKMLSTNLFQKGIAQIITSLMVSSWQPMKRLAYGRAGLVPVAVTTSWTKCQPMNERLLSFKMVSSNILIVLLLGVPGVKVSAYNFM